MEGNREAVRSTNTLAFYLSSASLYGPICHSRPDRAARELVQSTVTCWGTCHGSCNAQRGVPLAILPEIFLWTEEDTTRHFTPATRICIWRCSFLWQAPATILPSKNFPRGFLPLFSPWFLIFFCLCIHPFAKPLACVCCLISTTTRGNRVYASF